jgi:membrane peptidoglycan carboxypeptidase
MKHFNYVTRKPLSSFYKSLALSFIVKFLMITIIIFLMMIGQVFLRGYERFSEIYHGHMLMVIKTHQNNPDYVRLEDIPEMLIDATLAIEDRRFYHHMGFDLKAIARASIQNLFSGEIISGGSTITQQVSKNLFLTFEQTYERKITELLLAVAIEEKFSKEEILELYLNVINYGDGQIGIYKASKHYFNKSPQGLSPSESILLSGLPQGPSRYNLNNNLENAYKRSDQVLMALVDYKVIKGSQKSMFQNKIRKVRINPWISY